MSVCGVRTWSVGGQHGVCDAAQGQGAGLRGQHDGRRGLHAIHS